MSSRTPEQGQAPDPYGVFGKLALSFAETHFPDDPSREDRALTVIQALRHIAGTPSLVARIIDASPTDLEAILPAPSEVPSITDVAATKLQRQVSTRGYFDRSMALDNRIVRFEYATEPSLQPRRRRKRLADASTTSITALPTTTSWIITQYGDYSDFYGYANYVGTRKFELPTFRILAATNSVKTPASLSNLVGQQVAFDTVTIGTQLIIDSDFRKRCKEVPGYDDNNSYSSDTLTLPATLQQIYLGTDDRYPLFNE